MDLRGLFSFDKLRESGRVSVITTEEFIEKEALSGNLEIAPSENVMRLDVTVRCATVLERRRCRYDTHPSRRRI